MFEVFQVVESDNEDFVEIRVPEEGLAVLLSIAIAQQTNDVPLFCLCSITFVFRGRSTVHEVEDAVVCLWS